MILLSILNMLKTFVLEAAAKELKQKEKEKRIWNMQTNDEEFWLGIIDFGYKIFLTVLVKQILGALLY